MGKQSKKIRIFAATLGLCFSLKSAAQEGVGLAQQQLNNQIQRCNQLDQATQDSKENPNSFKDLNDCLAEQSRLENLVREENAAVSRRIQGGARESAVTSQGDGASPAAGASVAFERGPNNFGEACEKATDKAGSACNFSKDNGAKAAIMMADQMRGQIKAMSMSSPAMLCSKMGSLSQTIDIAVAAFSTKCTSAYSECDSSCDADAAEIEAEIEKAKAMKKAGATAYANQADIVKRISDLEDRAADVKKAKRTCSKYAGSIQNVMGNIGSYATIEAAKSQYCGEKTDALAELCKSQPSNALCAGKAGNTDCSNPSVAASNLTCICQANRNDPRCTALSKAGLSSGFNNANTGSGSGAGSAADAAGDFGGLGGGEFGGTDPVNMNAGNDGGGGLPGQKGGGGGRGGLDMGGGGNPSAKPGAGRGNEGEGLNTKVLSGYGVGGSGGSVGRGGGGYGGAGGGNYAGYANRGYVAGNKVGQQPVDLKKFLPGGQMDPSRGLAGVSGPDGITGPNTDIWKKVNSRYFNLQPSLLP